MAKQKHFMNKIGFLGFGDSTGPGKTILLSLLLGGLFTLLAYFVVWELLVAYPSMQSVNYIIVLVVAVVVAFFAVFWRHIPLIILLSLLSAISVFSIVHVIASEKHTAFPAAISAKFIPSEEKLQEIEYLRGHWLARVTYYSSVSGKSGTLPTGAIITILTTSPDNTQYESKYRYQGKEGMIHINSFKKLRVDRTYKIKGAGNLLASPSADATMIKKIPKGQKVTLTGESSADNSLLEVTHSGDKGWIASDAVFAPIELRTANDKNFEPKMPSIPLTVIALVLVVLMYCINLFSAIKKQKAYYTRQCGQFPWLANYIKKFGNPAVSEASGIVNDNIGKIIIACLISFAAGFAANIFFAIVYMEAYQLIPNQFGNMFLNIGTVAGPLAAVIATLVIWLKSIRTVATVYVCEKCGCPHSYHIIRTQNIVDGQRTDKVTVTTTTTNLKTGSRSSEDDTYRNLVYEGRELADYKCFNCKHEYHSERKTEWKGLIKVLASTANKTDIYNDADRPDEEVIEYHPREEGVSK